MMMAHDSSPPPAPGLAEETVARARGALSGYLDDPEARRQELRDALDGMAVEAREKKMLPEQLLVILKDIWYSLPEVPVAARIVLAVALLALRVLVEHVRYPRQVPALPIWCTCGPSSRDGACVRCARQWCSWACWPCST